MKVAVLTGSVSRSAGGLFVSVRRLAQTVAQSKDMQIDVLSLKDSYTESDVTCWGPIKPRTFDVIGPRAFGLSPGLKRNMLAMDAERMSLLQAVSSEGIAFEDAFENLYAQYAVGKKSLSETLRQSPIHGNQAFPAPDAVNTRYINEDLPFGLAPWSSIGRQWGIPTPNLDAVIQIASTMLNLNYFTQGLTAADLGIENMRPEDVRAMLE